MGVRYHGVHWNRQKIAYDLVISGMVVLGFGTFVAVSVATNPSLTAETLLMRGTAFLCLFLLQVILCIGPLARLSRWFVPLLYNRRHLGVCMFLLASVHGLIALVQHHAFGNRFPLAGVFTAYGHEFAAALHALPALAHVPFEPFGLAALAILFLMAATSHDFWLRLLGASLWKALHLLVYVAYGLILVHVALGFLQSETSIAYVIYVFGGALLVFGLHFAAWWKERIAARIQRRTPLDDGFILACEVEQLKPDRGKGIRLGNRRLAIFLHGGRVYALHGVCRHQGGPIAEGRIVDGCVTCPWHGWQYKPEDGCSPPPFEEHIAAYPVAIRDGKVFVNPEPVPQGTTCEGAPLTTPIDPEAADGEAPFFIGYQNSVPARLQPFLNTAASILLIAAPLLCAFLAYFQAPQAAGLFEFGQSTTLSGVLYTTPAPSLYVTPAGASSGYHVLLCSTGKFGIPPAWRSLEGTPVAVEGTLIYREGTTMVEVSTDTMPAPLPAGSPPTQRPATEVVGPVTLVGELVDTKCYLGVMRPATGKVHRACAIRCLSGGVPPGLLVRTERDSAVVMLAGPAQESLQYDITWAGREVRARGILERQNGFSLVRVHELSLYTPGAGAAGDG